MDIGEVVFVELPNLFILFVDNVGKFFSWMTNSIADWVDILRENVDNDVVSWIINFLESKIENQIPFSLFWDVPIIAIMFGGTLLFYVIFQLATWILNIIT